MRCGGIRPLCHREGAGSRCRASATASALHTVSRFLRFLCLKRSRQTAILLFLGSWTLRVGGCRLGMHSNLRAHHSVMVTHLGVLRNMPMLVSAVIPSRRRPESGRTIGAGSSRSISGFVSAFSSFVGFHAFFELKRHRKTMILLFLGITLNHFILEVFLELFLRFLPIRSCRRLRNWPVIPRRRWCMRAWRRRWHCMSARRRSMCTRWRRRRMRTGWRWMRTRWRRVYSGRRRWMRTGVSVMRRRRMAVSVVPKVIVPILLCRIVGRRGRRIVARRLLVRSFLVLFALHLLPLMIYLRLDLGPD
mmetsp:Transcript_85622/g.128278  ORF Transcript_85622/g.128278 Transcript_85622/m.128278 type:complete len:305 (-) Transcript_85622:646-1560(-)